MTDMPRPRPPFLSREVSRHGKPVWYLRRNGKRIRLRPEFGTPEFDAEYQAGNLPTAQRGQHNGGGDIGLAYRVLSGHSCVAGAL